MHPIVHFAGPSEDLKIRGCQYYLVGIICTPGTTPLSTGSHLMRSYKANTLATNVANKLSDWQCNRRPHLTYIQWHQCQRLATTKQRPQSSALQRTWRPTLRPAAKGRGGHEEYTFRHTIIQKVQKENLPHPHRQPHQHHAQRLQQQERLQRQQQLQLQQPRRPPGNAF